MRENTKIGGEVLKKIWLGILGLSVFFLSLVLAPIVTEYVMHETATSVENTVSLKWYLDGVEFTNDSTLDWGTLNVTETYFYNLTVVNEGTVNTKVSVLTIGLPVGWSRTWTANNTVLAPDSWVAGDLDLYVGSKGTFNWDTKIVGEQV